MVLLMSVLTFLSPIIAIVFLLFALFKCKKENKKYIVFLLSISIGIIFFHLVPSKEMDLYRYYKLMESYKISSFNYVNEILYEAEPISYSLMYFVSKLWNNGFLPFISTILYFNIFYYSIDKVMKKYNFNEKQYNLTILYLLSVSILVTIATGVRFSLATSLFICALSFFFENKRKRGYLFLILSFLSHTTLIFPVIIYLFIHLKKGKVRFFEYIILCIIIFSPSFLIGIITSISSLPYLSNLILKLGYYYQVYFPGGTWYIFRIIIFILNFILLYKTKKIKSDDSFFNSIINLQFFLAIISILTLPYYNISIRFMNIFNNISIFIIIYNNYKNTNQSFIRLLVFSTLVLYGSRNIIQVCNYNFGSRSITEWLGNIVFQLK